MRELGRINRLKNRRINYDWRIDREKALDTKMNKLV